MKMYFIYPALFCKYLTISLSSLSKMNKLKNLSHYHPIFKGKLKMNNWGTITPRKADKVKNSIKNIFLYNVFFFSKLDIWKCLKYLSRNRQSTYRVENKQPNEQFDSCEMICHYFRGEILSSEWNLDVPFNENRA